VGATVIEALRRFIPELLKTAPPLSPQQRRAIRAMTHCRTAALGGRVFGCEACRQTHFAYHSCNHKACPQCGAATAARWVQRQSAKRVNAPYFLVTFTLPAELRGCFFGPLSKQAYDLFFAAVSRALSEKLAAAKGFRAQVSGFIAALHTWNQWMGFHPHIHCLVPGAGINARGRVVCVKAPDFLVHRPHLQAAFRQQFYRLLKQQGWPVDPVVWRKDWGVDIQPVGSGAAALKYLARYVARTAISNARMLEVTRQSVTFRWNDRANDRMQTVTLPGVEFVRRYLRHVLPPGLRSVRYYGFCHPAAKANWLRVQLHTGMNVQLGSTDLPALSCCPRCPKCHRPMQLIGSIAPAYSSRGPPDAISSRTKPNLSSPIAA
jgi:hypothetical protein